MTRFAVRVYLRINLRSGGSIKLTEADFKICEAFNYITSVDHLLMFPC